LSRGDIVALALPVFARRGPDAVSIREVAELAGIRKASMYHHFESKNALYEAVMDDAVGRLFELVAAARLDEGDFVDRLDRLGALIIDYLAAHPETARLVTRELIGAGPYLSGRGGEQVQATLGVTAAFLESGMKAGAFRRSHPKHLALSIASLHLLPFAMSEPVEAFLGAKLSAKAQVSARKAAVLAQVRRLCVA
jgi:TetR/AcrR family transcriptional regulator